MTYRSWTSVLVVAWLASSPWASAQYPFLNGSLSTLDIETCGGLVNQRISILYGLVIAKMSRRAVNLPMLRLVGGETSSARMVPFGHLFDADHFIKTISPHVPVTSVEDQSPFTLQVQAHDAHLLWTQANLFREPTHISCPLFKLPPDTMLQHASLVRAWLSAFKPAPRFDVYLSRAVENMQAGSFNFLHWRAEEAWKKYCQLWKPGRPDNNCDTNTDNVASFLLEKQVEASEPLYISANWGNVEKHRARTALESLAANGYKVLTQQQLFGTKAMQELEHEERALLEYELALRAAKFVGNSASTFSALLIWERPGWSSYYNLGDVPLMEFLPFLQVPWVFPYSTRAAPYNYTIKMAVTSALATGTIKPFCLFDGEPQGDMYTWLLQHNVTIVNNNIKWAERLYSKPSSAHTPDMMIGTLQRIDIPIQKQLRQYNYMLYTDADVIFTQPLYWTDFPLPLPKSILMGYGADPTLPCDTGVMLVNMVTMQRTYAAFLEHILSNDQMYWPGYGPLDQGALNSFYMASMDNKCGLPRDLNMPMLLEKVHTAKVLHFLGPKLHQYGHWARTGNCSMADTFSKDNTSNPCELGIHSLCAYLPAMLQQTLSVIEADVDQADLHALTNLCEQRFPHMQPVPFKAEEEGVLESIQ